MNYIIGCAESQVGTLILLRFLIAGNPAKRQRSGKVGLYHIVTGGRSQQPVITAKCRGFCYTVRMEPRLALFSIAASVALAALPLRGETAATNTVAELEPVVVTASPIAREERFTPDGAEVTLVGSDPELAGGSTSLSTMPL